MLDISYHRNANQNHNISLDTPRIDTTRKWKITSIGKDVKQLKFSHIAGGNVK